jgi:protein tyrosine phosphatase domain-containing protein 1
MSDQLHPAIMIHPSYNKLSERIRKMAPPDVICQMFCGGKKCKYDNSRWAPTDMVIDGIFSHW